MTKLNKMIIILVLVIVYIALKNYIPYGNIVLYPITLLVTFLHELWHALWALLTWWVVVEIDVSTDGSWYAVTWGGWRPIVLMWGYIWSAVLWNILLYIGFKKHNWAQFIIYFLALLMIFTAFVWFSSMLTTVLLIISSMWFIILAFIFKYDHYILQFLWVASILYIMEDFNMWPTSDLAKFSEIFIIVPQFAWMYIWLFIVILITWKNVKSILKEDKNILIKN